MLYKFTIIFIQLNILKIQKMNYFMKLFGGE